MINRSKFLCPGITIESTRRVILLSLFSIFSSLTYGDVSARQFEEQALPVLELEQPFDFINQHTQGLPPLSRDPDARLSADELAIDDKWRIAIPAHATVPLTTAAQELQQYLKVAMRVDVALLQDADLTTLSGQQPTILAGTRDQLPGAGADLKASKDYRIMVTDNVITVCGFDELGTMYGLYNLTMRFRLREAPFLPKKLDTVRHSLYQARMTLSGLGWMTWPDRYLATLPLYGFDAIFCSIYRNPNNAPGVGPYWDDTTKRKHPTGAMQDLIRRAARCGIACYAPLLYQYTGTPENIAGLRKLVRDVITEFPEIRGYVLLSEGFCQKKWFGAVRGNDEALRASVHEWCTAVNIAAAEAHAINPDVEILPWDYNVSFRPDQTNNKAYVMAQLPETTIPLLTFENGASFELDGQKGYLRDYAINQVGPAEVTQAQLSEARKRHFRAVYSKADTFASWQFGTFPYLPFPYQWYARYQALEECGIQGTLESWSYGFKPNWVAEMRAWYSWTDAPPLDDLLRQIARRDFGQGNEDDVLEAWRCFSEAVKKYPDTGPNWGSCNAVAAPLFFSKPQDRHVTRRYGWSHDNLPTLDPWPYAIRRMILWPDFTNKRDAAQSYIGFFSVPTFQKHLLIAADLMEQGLKHYRHAALAAPESKRKAAFREVLLAEQLQRMMRSEHAIIEFEQMRLALAKASDSDGQNDLLNSMIDLLHTERQRTVASYETARRDSRLGYEWEQDYVYTPASIREKIKLIDDTINFQIPDYRQINGLNKKTQQ